MKRNVKVAYTGKVHLTCIKTEIYKYGVFALFQPLIFPIEFEVRVWGVLFVATIELICDNWRKFIYCAKKVVSKFEKVVLKFHKITLI